MIKIMRLHPDSEDSRPWLIRQFRPSMRKPQEAKYFVNKPASGHQMATARIAVAGLYLLNLTVPAGEQGAKVRSNAYMWRRGMPGVAEKMHPP